jgi:Flp pilus assembly protein TadG
MQNPGSARPGWRNADGAVLVHIAVAILGLLAFCALVIDYGVMWASRRQAQNAADAGAHAGAVSLAFEGAGFERARVSAKTVGEVNRVFGATLNITQGAGAPGTAADDISFVCPPGETGPCVRVNVYRTQARGNPLPTFFAHVAGVTTHGVKATATAIVGAGNATQCMRPFGLMDKWDEWDDGTNGGEYETLNGFMDPSGRSPNWDPDYWVPQPSNGNMPAYSTQFSGSLYEADRYVPPSSTSPGTGYRLYAPNSNDFCCDYGQRLALTVGYTGTTDGGFLQPLRVVCSGANCFRDAIEGCDGVTRVVGESVDTEMGEMVGPVTQGVNRLIAQDPAAEWYPAGTSFPGGLQCPDYGGCVYSPANGVNASPRIVPVPVMNPDTYMQDPNGMSSVTIMNLMGLFIVGMEGSGPTARLIGRIVPAPGIYAGCPPGVSDCTIVDEAAFLKVVVLVR